jgi:UDP-N-acetylmuramate--alanine ligase
MIEKVLQQADQLSRLRKIKGIHMLGIGGAGMSGIAEVLINLGYQVSGSDLSASPATEKLIQLGAKIEIGHSKENVKEADVVVVSSAISSENPELQAAKAARIPVVPRAEMLAELMRFKYGIAIAGTHGKTTTTSLIASIFAAADVDPTYVIGGRLNSAGVHAKKGEGHYFIAEADESDASFLHLQPMISIVTNIEADHLETYEGDFAKYREVYEQFLQNLPFYGLAVLCYDDPVVVELGEKLQRPKVSYGLNDQSDIYATDLEYQAMGSRFTVHRRSHNDSFDVVLNIPGQHNVLNALAAIAVASEENIPLAVMQQALAEFQGVGRRFELLGQAQVGNSEVTLVDDYGHHPTEIEATLKAAKQVWPGKRLVMLCQPHRYTRTRDLFEDFVRVLAEVDLLLLLDVYSAGEEEISGATSKDLARSIRQRGSSELVYVNSKEEVPELLERLLVSEDILLTQGAGDVGKLAKQLVDTYGVK